MDKISIVVPVRQRNWDIIIVENPNKAPGRMRDEGARVATTDIIAFLDDDSFPDFKWIDTATKIFDEDENIAIVTGPSYTPPSNGFWEQCSGHVYKLLGGWRYNKTKRKLVQDVPTCNMLIRKKVFDEVGGFDTDNWPGEDTILCEKVLRKGYVIVCAPGVAVWHHRRGWSAHLDQVKRYATMRGKFVRLYPITSAKLKYFMPVAVVVLLALTVLVYAVNFVRGLAR